MALTLFAGPIAAQEDVFLEAKERIVERREAALDVQRRYPAIEVKYQQAEAAYNAVLPSFRACKRKAWGPVFEDVLKEAESARAELEKGNDAIKAKRREAMKALRTQDDKRINLDRSYAAKPKDDTYYEKRLEITLIVQNDYTDVMNDVVISGYQKYTDGFTELTAAYRIYGEDCQRALPSRAVKQTLTKVVQKVDIVKLIATALLGIVGLA